QLISECAIRHVRCVIVAELGVRHPERSEDSRGREIAKRLPRCSLHNDRKERVAGVAVKKLLAWRKIETSLTRDQLEELLFGEHAVARPTRHCQQGQVVTQPTGVVQQMPQPDRWSERRHLRHPLSNIVIEREAMI